MDQKETATYSKMSQQKTPSNDDLPQAVKNVKDSSPTTPTTSSPSSSWWGGFISQAKEKVSQNFIQLIMLIIICFTKFSQHRFFKR